MIVAILAALGATAAPVRCPPASQVQVRDEFDRWVKAYELRDLDGTMAIFDPKVQFQFQGAPDADWTALKSSYAEEFAKLAKVRWVPRWDQIILSGRTAAAFSQWTALVAESDGRSRTIAENRGVDVLKRGHDCRWRIVRSLNYPIKPPAPAAK